MANKENFPFLANLDEDRKAELTAVLLKEVQEDDYIHPEVFNELFGTIPGTALEVVPIYINDEGEVRVFMTQRGENDKFWPREWHCPGTMILNKDAPSKNSFHDAWNKLEKNEFMEESLSEPVHVSNLPLSTNRGIEVALVYFVLVPGDLKGGEFFSLDNLPENTVDHHLPIIRDAVYDLGANIEIGRIRPLKNLSSRDISLLEKLK